MLAEFKAQNIKYAISIGRRAPMHIVHLDCFHEIKAAGLQPVIIIGSCNPAGDKYYDPFRNPLTITQQYAQLNIVLGAEYNPEHIYTLDDQDDDAWLATLMMIARRYAGQAVLHYRTKLIEKTKNIAQIPSLLNYLDAFNAQGLAVWQTYNTVAKFDDVHASDLRKLDLCNLSAENKKLFAAAEFIIQTAISARNSNPDKQLLANMPITMLDLSLLRLCEEANIRTASLLNAGLVPGYIQPS